MAGKKPLWVSYLAAALILFAFVVGVQLAMTAAFGVPWSGLRAVGANFLVWFGVITLAVVWQINEKVDRVLGQQDDHGVAHAAAAARLDQLSEDLQKIARLVNPPLDR